MSVPPGARCGRHPELPAGSVCVRCGDFLCADCDVGTREGQSACKGCRPHASEPFPWEQRAEIGLLRALGRTLRATLTRTDEVFARGFRDRSVLPAMAYGAAIATPMSALTLLFLDHAPRPSLSWMFTPEVRLVRALAAPLAFAAVTLFVSAFWWLGLAAVGAAKPTISHVVRTVAYVRGSMALTAPVLLLPSPIDGVATLAAAVVTLVLEGRALAAQTRSSEARVAAAGVVAVVGIFTLVCGAGVAGFLVWRGPGVP